MILIHFNLNTEPGSLYRYQGTGCVQFAYPEDAERAIRRINGDGISVYGRVLRMTRADRDFDVRRISNVPTQSRHWRFPRISLSGDEDVMDSEEHNWHRAPADWVGIVQV